MSDAADLLGRLGSVRRRIADAEVHAKRAPGSVRLIAVSKRHPGDAISEAAMHGQLDFGENYASELVEKAADLPHISGWHFIGRLQRNKVRPIVRLAACIHTIDSVRLAQRVALIAKDEQCAPDVFIMVNVGAEAQKAGCAWDDIDRVMDACGGLNVVGLMAMPPVSVDPRPYFERLAEAAMQRSLPRLSMGMSADMEAAIDFGATDVRVGSAIFGPRPLAKSQQTSP